MNLFFVALVHPSFAVTVELYDPGTLAGEWTESIQEGTSDSARSFLAFVGHGAIEQAFTLQHSPVMSSAAWSPDGLQLGVQLDTFPFRAPPVNGQGKVENTEFIPVIPRFVASFAGGERVRLGAGLSLVPPVSVRGASALVVGGEVSVGGTVTPWLSLAGELDVSAGQAYAPVVATPEARAAGVLENVDEARYNAICVPQTYGCTDSLLIRHGGAHLVAAFRPDQRVVPWVRLGGRLVDDRFIIQVDLTDWRVSGPLFEAGAGASISLAERWSLGVGGILAPLPEEIVHADDLPLLYRFTAGATWRPGA